MLRLLPRLPADFQQPPTAAEITAFAARLLGPDAVIAEAVELGGGAFNNTFRLTTADGHRSILRLSPPPAHPLLFHVEHHLLRREHSLTPWLSAVSEFLPRTLGCVFEIDQVGVGGEVGSAKATEVEAGQRPVPPRATLDQPASPLTRRVRRPELFQKHTLSTDFSHTICPRNAILSEFIEGENWDSVMPALTPAENDTLWRELAALLRRIHATPAPHFGWTSPATPHTRWSDFALDNIRGLLADCQRLAVPHEEACAWAAVAERCAPALDLITEPRVLHGDPWPKNVLIRRDANTDAPRIVALLDHERGGFGDPQSEWVFHGCDFPPVFWESYGPRPTDPASQIRANLYRGTIAIQCLLESTRYPDVDTATPRKHLANATKDLRHLLKESNGIHR